MSHAAISVGQLKRVVAGHEATIAHGEETREGLQGELAMEKDKSQEFETYIVQTQRRAQEKRQHLASTVQNMNRTTSVLHAMQPGFPGQ